MNAERLLQLYERIAEAPDAIARLRRFILDLAVRGKLVPQNQADEPVSELIGRIRARSGRNVSPQTRRLNSDVQPPLPSGWILVRLGDVTNVRMGQSPPGHTYNRSGDGVPLINGPVEFTDGPFGRTVVNQHTTAPTNYCEEGDLLICVRGSTTGRTNVAAHRACIGRGVAAIQPLFEDEFLRLFIWNSRNEIIEMGRGIAFPSVSRKQIEGLQIPFPPLAEQHRIVAKVDELMALCDRLEAARTAREATRDRLTAASLARLNAPDPETFAADAPFALDALSALTARPDQIKHLRQTILNLAVRGKLVPQDPKDEPAGKVALKIVEKRRGQLREDVEEPYALPTGWAWRAVATLADQVTDGEHATPPRIPEAQIPLVTAKNVRGGYMDYSRTDWVSKATAEKAWARCKPNVGDLLMVCVGATTGRVTVLREPCDMVLVRSVALIRPNNEIDVEYLERTIRSSIVQRQIWESVKTAAQPCLYINRIQSLLVPLPPLAEQRRIVAKIDSLMALCDRLEASLSTAADTRGRLLDALLAEALAPAAAPQREAAE